MNTKQILRNLRFIVIGSVVAIALSYVVHATGTWNAAPVPPANNTDRPVNVGGTSQVKNGSLAVNAFTALQDAQFVSQADFNGTWYGNPGSSSISIGGYNTQTGVEDNVGLKITGAFNNTGSIAGSTLVNGTNSTVCADANGNVVLCSGGGGPGGPQTKQEFLATGSGTAEYTGFVRGCAQGNDGNYNVAGNGDFFTGAVTGDHPYIQTDPAAKGGGGCGSHYPDDNGDNNYGHVAKVALNSVIINTLPGFSPQNADIVSIDASEVPPPFWVVKDDGYYAINFKSDIHWQARITDGNYIAVAGFFIKVVNKENTASTMYPLINTPSWKGVDAPLNGYDCNSGSNGMTLGSGIAAGGYGSNPYLDVMGQDFGAGTGEQIFSIGNSWIQNALVGDCRTLKHGNWNNAADFGLSFNQTIYLTAGAKVYVYGALAGMGYDQYTFLGGYRNDQKDFTLDVSQSSNSIHVVKQ